MSPLEFSYAFATIVGLLCNFKQANEANKEAGHLKFMEWLENHRHEDVKKMIANSAALQMEVATFLRQDSKDIFTKMSEIERILAQLLSRVSGFAGIARTIHPEFQLSKQATEVLCQLADSKTGMLGVTGDAHPETGDDCDIFFFPTQADFLPPDAFRPEEGKFFADDIATLVSLGLIRLEKNDNERLHPIYRITRIGADYAKVVSEQSSRVGMTAAKLIHGRWL